MNSVKNVVHSFFHDVLTDGKVDKLSEFLHENYQSQKFSTKKWTDLALHMNCQDQKSNLHEVVNAFQQTIHDMKFTIKSIVEEENKVAVFWSVIGKGYQHPTLKELKDVKWETDGAHFFELKDGKIIKINYVADSLSAYIQAKMAIINENEFDKMKTYIYALENLELYNQS